MVMLSRLALPSLQWQSKHNQRSVPPAPPTATRYLSTHHPSTGTGTGTGPSTCTSPSQRHDTQYTQHTRAHTFERLNGMRLKATLPTPTLLAAQHSAAWIQPSCKLRNNMHADCSRLLSLSLSLPLSLPLPLRLPLPLPLRVSQPIRCVSQSVPPNVVSLLSDSRARSTFAPRAPAPRMRLPLPSSPLCFLPSLLLHLWPARSVNGRHCVSPNATAICLDGPPTDAGADGPSSPKMRSGVARALTRLLPDPLLPGARFFGCAPATLRSYIAILHRDLTSRSYIAMSMCSTGGGGAGGGNCSRSSLTAASREVIVSCRSVRKTFAAG